LDPDLDPDSNDSGSTTLEGTVKTDLRRASTKFMVMPASSGLAVLATGGSRGLSSFRSRLNLDSSATAEEVEGSANSCRRRLPNLQMVML
jgi:hypothetical protein